jgi:hypothetical protein
MSDITRVSIRGIPNIPSIREVNARRAPNTSSEIIAKVPVGAILTEVHEVRPDSESKALNSKVYQWFYLALPDGNRGWIRDDLLELQGDFRRFGYETYRDPVFAFDRVRREKIEDPVVESPPTPEPPSQRSIDDPERVRMAAFAVTAAFEGKGYDSFQNYDSGIISYGRFQFTLAAGSLGTVVTRFLERSSSPTAQELRRFHPGIMNRDQGLRHNQQLKQLLIAAASEDAMKQVQNDLAKAAYWDRMLEISARPRGVQSPLGLALLFDIAINFGVMNALLGLAEKDLGVLPKSRLGQNGLTEQQFIAGVANRRRLGHYAQAERDNLPGLKVRGDFWVDLVTKGDFTFLGDAAGCCNVNGKIIQIRTPAPY